MATPPEVRSSTVDRAMAIMTHLAESGGTSTVTQVSDACNLPLSTTHRLLRSLASNGWVEPDPHTREYQLGPEMFRVAGLASSNFDLVAASSPHLEALLRASGETVLLGVYLPHHHRMMFAARRDSRHPLQYRVELHTPLSLLWGASGRSILAFLEPDAQMDALSDPDESPASGDRLDHDQLSEHLDRIRSDGYALSRGQRLAGAVGIAAPITRRGHGVVANVCLTIPADRFDPSRLDDLVAELLAATAVITAIHP